MKHFLSLQTPHWGIFILALGSCLLQSSHSEEQFKCPEQFGYYPDMQDCTKYYVCVFGDFLHEKCTGGLYFHVKLQTCDWPRNVECANGVKPGEEILSTHDEEFPSSRRTSATATTKRVQWPLEPNPDPVTNYQPSDSRDSNGLSRNSPSPGSQTQRSRSPPTTTTFSPPSTIIPSTQSPRITTSSSLLSRFPQTTRSAGSILLDNTPTTEKDPLHESDKEGEVSPDLNNNGQETGQFVFDSNGGFHISEGLGSIDVPLPGFGFEKADEPGVADDDYSEDQDDTEDAGHANTAVGSRPRSVEPVQSNNGKQNDPDVVDTYPTAKESGYNVPDRKRAGTPVPTIFDDNVEHKDYVDFTLITPQRNSQRDSKSPTGLEQSGNPDDDNKRDTSLLNSASPAIADTPLLVINRDAEVPRLGSSDERSLESIETIPSNNNPQQDVSEAIANQGLPLLGHNTQRTRNLGVVSSNTDSQVDPTLPPLDLGHGIHLPSNIGRYDSVENKPSDARSDRYIPPNTSTNIDLSPSQRSNQENSEHFNEHISSNNGNSRDPDVELGSNSGSSIDPNIQINLNSNRKGPEVQYVDPNYSDDIQQYPGTTRYRQPNTDRPSQNSNALKGQVSYFNLGSQRPDNRDSVLHSADDHEVELISSVQPNDGNQRDSSNPNYQRDQEPVRNTNLPEDRQLPVIRSNNGKPKDPDTQSAVPEGDFGTYTGNQRQGRKYENPITPNNAEQQSLGDGIPFSVRQPNQPQQNPNEKNQRGSSSQPEEYPDQYDSVYHRGYGEYDSPKPHFPEDYYTGDDDHETTTRTTQIVRTRPTRPRRPTTVATTTTTTTTTTTPAPARQRTRRPLTQVTRPSKPPPITTQSPPSRPAPLYPTPSPLTSAQKCDPRKCRLPDCRCGGTDIPSGFAATDIPQIVLLTFDDAVNDLNYDLYNELFNTGRKNPNGCPILGTFYVSHEWTDYGQVQTLYSHGHEMASHSITHSYGEKFHKNQWMREINGQREILHLYGGVKMEDIRGMRAPFLQIGGNKMFEMLFDANFTYDSSMPVYENNPPFWPYTLDYALNHECMITPCPTKSFPGLWEVGMVMWVDLRGGRCSMGDACSNPPDEEAVTKMLLKNFNRHYKSNRAPFGLFYHSAWFNTQHHRRGFMKFLDEILQKGDVWLVTNWQLIEWIRNPTPVSKMKDFEPFNCRRLDRPPPCHSPTVCNVWYQGGVRYMKTCQPCPAKYPWVGNTGYDSNSRG